MRKINLFLMAVLVAFASFVKVSAKIVIEGLPADIDFSNGVGNYVLFYSADETLRNVDMTSNKDNPFGYYVHWINDGTYQKFRNHYETTCGITGWCNDKTNWFYILDSGGLHPMNNDSPAIMFTAPADGWYYVGMTFKREQVFDTYLSIRNRFVHNDGSNLSCPYTEELCSMKFGKKDTSWHTMDYFVKLKAGDKITTEEYAEGRASSGGVTVSRYVVAANTSADTPISDEYVASSGLPSYDPRAQEVVEPAEGKVAIRVVGTEKYLVKKEKAKDKNFFYAAIFAPNDITTEASKKSIPLSDFDWEFDIVKNTNGGYNIKLGDYYKVSDGYIDKTTSADNNRFTFYTPKYFESGIAIKREADGKYWKDNMQWKSPYNKIETSTDPIYVFELVEAPAATPYAFFNFDMAETATDNLKAVANRNGYTVNVNLTRSLSNQYWNTFCVPFDISAAKIVEIFGEGTLITEFTGVEGTTMMLTATDAVVAGKPYLVKPANTVVNPSFTDVKITEAAPQKVTFGDYSFTGVYEPTTINTDGTDLFVTSTGGLSKPADNTKNTIKGMRAYITVPSGTAAKLSIMGTTTSVEKIAVGNGNDTDKVYNINGQLIDGNAKGIVVKKGKKFVAK